MKEDKMTKERIVNIQFNHDWHQKWEKEETRERDRRKNRKIINKKVGGSNNYQAKKSTDSHIEVLSLILVTTHESIQFIPTTTRTFIQTNGNNRKQ